MASYQAIAEKVQEGRRITSDDAFYLYNSASFAELGVLADIRRQQIVPGNVVTYLIDRNINYTNVCNTDCTFCGFYRSSSNHPEAYVLSREQLRAKIEEALELGATRILLQGGHNDDLSFDFYVEMISWIASEFPIEINAFSPSEIHQMHKVSSLSYEEILFALKEAGMRGLPGGGAELLVESIRKRFSPKKINADTWLEIMKVAQTLGITTTSTMVIGFGEGIEVRLEHLERLRQHQDEVINSGATGFNAFISWVLQHNENTSVGRSRHRHNYGATSIEYLRNSALARVFLDNIPHHAASWPTLGAETGKVALHFGCDDFGSTMMEENVVSTAGALTAHKWAMSPAELEGHIRDAGFIPAQRNTSYEILRVAHDNYESALPHVAA